RRRPPSRCGPASLAVLLDRDQAQRLQARLSTSDTHRASHAVAVQYGSTALTHASTLGEEQPGVPLGAQQSLPHGSATLSARASTPATHTLSQATLQQ